MRIDDIILESDSYRADLCKPGTMLLQPSEHALPIMRSDYQAMRQMIYGNYPSFDELLETLMELEAQVNSLAD